MKTKRNNKKGFTIVELVIVIAVIAILATVLIPTFSSIVQKAKESSVLQAARNEMIEIKASLIASGNDLPEGTVFGQDDVYYEYRNGELVKLESYDTNGKFETELNGVSVWGTSGVIVGFDNTKKTVTEGIPEYYSRTENKDKYVEIRYPRTADVTVVIKNSAGVTIYNSTYTGQETSGVYFSMYTPAEETPASGDATTLKTKPSADYYYYTVTDTNGVVASGVFYYG